MKGSKSIKPRLGKDELQRRREWAQLLYTKDSRSQKEISKTVCISEKTISDWKTAYNWDGLRKSITQTKEEQLTSLYDQLEEFNNFIKSKPVGSRFPDSKEADALKKIASSIKDLETDLQVSVYIDVFIALTKWYRTIDFKKTQDLSDILDQFIAAKL